MTLVKFKHQMNKKQKEIFVRSVPNISGMHAADLL